MTESPNLIQRIAERAESSEDTVLQVLNDYGLTLANPRRQHEPPPSFGPVAVRVVGFQLMGALPSVVDRCEVSER